MARKQTRRSVSLSVQVYSAAKEAAADRGITLAHLTEQALIAFGVKAEPGTHMSIDAAERVTRRRASSGLMVTRRVQAVRYVGMIRGRLGDSIADMLGEP